MREFYGPSSPLDEYDSLKIVTFERDDIIDAKIEPASPLQMCHCCRRDITKKDSAVHSVKFKQYEFDRRIVCHQCYRTMHTTGRVECYRQTGRVRRVSKGWFNNA